MPEFSFEKPPEGIPIESMGEETKVEKEKDTSELGEVLDKIEKKEAKESPETRPWIKKAGEYVKEGSEKIGWGLLKIAGWALVIGLWLSLKTIQKTAEWTQKGLKKIK